MKIKTVKIECPNCKTSFYNIFDMFFIRKNKKCYTCLEKQNRVLAEKTVDEMLILDENNALSM